MNSEVAAAQLAPGAWSLARLPFSLSSRVVNEVNDVLLVGVRADWEVVVTHVDGRMPNGLN